MMKETLRAIETGPLAEIGLVAFFVAFILVVIYAWKMPRRQREEAKHIPLEAEQEAVMPHQEV